MPTSKYGSRHYFSIESLLASEETLSCTFFKEENYVGFLEPGNTTDRVNANTTLELPYWVASAFVSYPRLVGIDLPKAYKKAYRDILQADATAVDLKSLCRYYYILGEYLIKTKHRESDEIKRILIQTFRKRFRMVMDWALNAASEQTVKKLDRSEMCIYESGKKTQEILDGWLKEGTSAIAATAMITSHKKRKVENTEII